MLPVWLLNGPLVGTGQVMQKGYMSEYVSQFPQLSRLLKAPGMTSEQTETSR